MLSVESLRYCTCRVSEVLERRQTQCLLVSDDEDAEEDTLAGPNAWGRSEVGLGPVDVDEGNEEGGDLDLCLVDDVCDESKECGVLRVTREGVSMRDGWRATAAVSTTVSKRCAVKMGVKSESRDTPCSNIAQVLTWRTASGSFCASCDTNPWDFDKSQISVGCITRHFLHVAFLRVFYMFQTSFLHGGQSRYVNNVDNSTGLRHCPGHAGATGCPLWPRRGRDMTFHRP